MQMRVMLIVVAVMMGVEALTALAFPGRLKRMIDSASPDALRIAGLVELIIVLALVYFMVTGAAVEPAGPAP